MRSKKKKYEEKTQRIMIRIDLGVHKMFETTKHQYS